jgi:O-antigen/teichoic acid export membrane protein
MRRTLARSSIHTTAMLGIRLMTQACNLILLTRWMGPAVFGQYTATASLAMIASLIPSLGSGFVLMSREARTPRTGNDVARYAWPLTLVLASALSLLFPIAAARLGGSVFSSPDLIVIGLTELFVTPFLMTCNAALQASHQAAKGQLVQWLPLGIRLFVTILCTTKVIDVSLRGFISLQLLAAGLGLLAAFVITSRSTYLPWRPRLPSRHELRSGCVYAAMNVVAANPSELDKVLAIRFLGEQASGIYSATARVLNAAITPVTGVLVASQQALFQHGANPDTKGKRLIRVIALVSAGWGVTSGLILAACSPLLPYLLGSRFAESASVMPWVATAAPFMSLRLAAGTILVALGKPMHRMAFELAGIGILVAFLGVGAQVGGPRGMSLGLAVAEMLMSGIGWGLVARAHDQILVSSTLEATSRDAAAAGD